MAAPLQRDFVSELRHQCSNNEAQISQLEEKLSNQEEILEALQKEMKTAQKTLQEALKTKTGTMETRLGAIETALQQISQDNAAFKKTLEKLGDTLMALHERIAGYETALAQHGSNVTHLQTALSTLTEAFQDPSSPPPGDASSYKVQPGDSLGKIAVKFGVSLKALREANNLSSDKIIAGQSLAIPKKDP